MPAEGGRARRAAAARLGRLVVAGLASTSPAACRPARGPAAVVAGDFACRDRLVSYVVNGALGGDELGVQIDCQEAGPRLRRWRVDRAGHRVDDSRAMTGEEFDHVWGELDGIGWRYLKDCPAGAGKRDPIYTFDVRDDQAHGTFSCQARVVPYPYDAFVNQLDLAATVGRPELDDEAPAARGPARGGRT